MIVVAATSCKKLIQIPTNPTNKLSKDRIFADSANIVAAVAGVYGNFGVTQSNLGFGNGAITIYTGLASDELIVGSETYTAPAFFENTILPDNSIVASMWSDAYKNIYQINICLDGVAKTTAISDKLKRQLIGELKTDRAFYYYFMANIWGGVPIITSTDYKVTQSTPRATLTDVFNFVLTDLKDAQQLLTAAYPSSGRKRPNLYVAEALLSKVYLYLGQYQNAIDAASTVISSPLYRLETLDRVFLSESSEAIWQLPANGANQETPEGASFIPFDATYQPNFVMSPQLLGAFESNDPRLTQWTNANTIGTDTYYYPNKYKNTLPGQTPLEDYMILRLADIYLVRAEAFAELEKYTEAMADLNTVRDRAADRPDLTAASKTQALTLIAHERQVELFCEWGNRWIDLKRTKMIDAVLGPIKSSWVPTDSLFPIPNNERQANPYLNQNPGYR